MAESRKEADRLANLALELSRQETSGDLGFFIPLRDEIEKALDVSLTPTKDAEEFLDYVRRNLGLIPFSHNERALSFIQAALAAAEQRGYERREE